MPSGRSCDQVTCQTANCPYKPPIASLIASPIAKPPIAHIPTLSNLLKTFLLS